MMQPLVTIITPVFNLIQSGRKGTFIQTMKSVQNQTYKNIEHIVMDGASTDGTLALLKKYQKKGWISYYSEPDKGIYDAMNKGILKAKGKYIVCLNSDDFYCDEHAIEWLVEKSELEHADACYGNAERVEPGTLKKIGEWNGRQSIKPWLNSWPCHQTFLIKTEVMKEQGLYDLQYKVSADNNFFMRMFQNNKKIVGVDHKIISFRDGGFSNSHLDLARAEQIEGLWREYGRYHGLTRTDCQYLWGYGFKQLPLHKVMKLGKKLESYEWQAEYFSKILEEQLISQNYIDNEKNGNEHRRSVPVRVLFDATVLNNYASKGAGRTGIYWVAYNLVIALSKRKEIKIFLWSKYPDKTKSFIRDELPQLDFYDGDIRNMDVFFSPVFKIDDCIKNTGIPCYTILYDCIAHLYAENFKNADMSWYYEMCNSLTEDDYCFAISKHTKKDFVKHIPQLDAKKIKIMPLATNIVYRPHQVLSEEVKKKYHIPLDKRYLFSLCSLEPRKNLIRSVKTFIQFIKKNKIDDLVFVLGGSAWKGFIEQFENEVTEYKKYQDKIIRAGYIDDQDLEALYGNAEWFVYTSQYEGFGLPPLEAMSCGTAVITSNNSSLPEVVGDAAQMVDWDSDAQHVAAYEKYYFNNEYRCEMVRKGLERSKIFSWDKTADIVVKALKLHPKPDYRQSFLLKNLQVPEVVLKKGQPKKINVKIFGFIPVSKTQVEINVCKSKFFGFIPYYAHIVKGGREQWKIFGLPIFKIRKMANGITTKYYILGVPVMKVSKKVQSV